MLNNVIMYHRRMPLSPTTAAMGGPLQQGPQMPGHMMPGQAGAFQQQQPQHPNQHIHQQQQMHDPHHHQQQHQQQQGNASKPSGTITGMLADFSRALGE